MNLRKYALGKFTYFVVTVIVQNPKLDGISLKEWYRNGTKYRIRFDVQIVQTLNRLLTEQSVRINTVCHTLLIFGLLTELIWYIKLYVFTVIS